MPIVIENARRPDPQAVDALGNFGVATIHEAQGRVGLLAPRLRPIYPGAHLAGAAVTVRVPPGDNWMLHVAVEQCKAGDVLVVTPTSLSDAGYFGDLLATALQARGVRGLVIDAGCRDVAMLARMGFPVWSSFVSATGTVKQTLGDVNVAICCAGQIVNPGDVIVADDDGVVVVAQDRLAAVLEAARARECNEEISRGRYRNGELSLDVHNMRGELAARGLVYLRQGTGVTSDAPPART